MSMRSCAVRVTIFSTGGKLWLVSNFMELHTLTQATRSYVLSVCYIVAWFPPWKPLSCPMPHSQASHTPSKGKKREQGLVVATRQILWYLPLGSWWLSSGLVSPCWHCPLLWASPLVWSSQMPPLPPLSPARGHHTWGEEGRLLTQHGTIQSSSIVALPQVASQTECDMPSFKHKELVSVKEVGWDCSW